ncbi:MAG: hypothetical protein DCC55_26765 [Chloroflexi bacterium]|nr:MAG: hypothetical protein DCC55_26765 [Chloroflexota bacterium]
MDLVVRILLVLGGIGVLALAAIFAFQREWAAALWFWGDSPLSFYFIAAMQAAIAAAMLWIGLSGELAALAPGALNLFVMMAGLAVSLYFIDLGDYAIACALFTLFNLFLFLWARRIPLRDEQPLPNPVRYSYWLFVVILAGVGLALLLGVEGVLPWNFGEENANTPILFGWMFFGDAFYFLYALLYPRWHNAVAQMLSFLAYDLVLLGPFLIRWPWIRDLVGGPRLPDDRLDNLVVYTLILLYSGALGVYYLLINPKTRLLERRT